MKCPHCPEEIRNDDLLHDLTCEGQQGAVEAAIEDDDGPLSTGGWDDPELNAMRAHARHTDPETSHQAAAKANVTRVDRAVLDVLARHDEGGTSEELATWTGLPLVNVSPRLKPLERMGLVIRDGRRRNRSGCTAIVWRARA